MKHKKIVILGSRITSYNVCYTKLLREFMRRHTRLGPSNHPFFPAVMLLMSENKEQTCPFLDKEGCTVYQDRPTACRTYPLERAVDRNLTRGRPKEYYFMTDHSYCLGHQEVKEWTVKAWLRDQKVLV